MRFGGWAGIIPGQLIQLSKLDSAEKPILGNFHPTKSPSTKIKTPHKRKGIVTNLNALKRWRFDSKNRGVLQQNQ
jgi:hypothetical protein